jgi:hypothetical protein
MKRTTANLGQTAERLAAWLAGLACLAAIGLPACSTAAAVSFSGCSLNSDCNTGLVCALGKCRSQCVTAADCAVAGSTCIDDGRNAVCEAPADKNKVCTSENDCPVPLACASDYRCRNLCETDADCNVLGITGRVCARDMNNVDYCADPTEVTGGVITIPPPPGAPVTPVMEPEGGTSAQVAAIPDGGIIVTNIGQGGGTVGAMGVTVTIPAGALTSVIPISIQLAGQVGPNGTVGQVFEIGPTGTTFAQPITIAFNYTGSELEGLPPSDFAVETSTNGGVSWTPLSQIVVDVKAQTIAGQTTHLSPYALVEQPVAMGVAEDAATYASEDSNSNSDAGTSDASSAPPADAGVDGP